MRYKCWKYRLKVQKLHIYVKPQKSPEGHPKGGDGGECFAPFHIFYPKIVKECQQSSEVFPTIKAIDRHETQSKTSAGMPPGGEK